MIKIDTRELTRLDRAFSSSAKQVSDKRVAGSAMRKALKPMLLAAKREAPVGSGAQRVSLKYRKSKDPNAYRKGGATRADQRIKIVPGEGTEVVRGLVGTDSRRGKVGFRTHLITRANKNRKRINNFLLRAFNRNINQTSESYGKEMLRVVDRIIKKR
jgi:hypothetical protein